MFSGYLAFVSWDWLIGPVIGGIVSGICVWLACRLFVPAPSTNLEGR